MRTRPFRSSGAVLLAVLSVAVLLVAAPADAASPRLTKSVARRYCVNTSKSQCNKIGTFKAGNVKMICWKDQSTATGAYKSKRWFYATQGTVKGWVHSSWVTRQAKVPNCSTHRGVSAATWAAERDRDIHTTSAIANALWRTPHDTRWSGGCAGFVYASYTYGAKRAPRFAGDARPKYNNYRAAGKVRSMSTEPTIGASVFYPSVAAPYGHEAIYLGGGIVQTTQGLPNETKPNARRSINHWGKPAGWVHPNDY